MCVISQRAAQQNAWSDTACRACTSVTGARLRGVGMLEFLIALLLFSIAVIGLLSTQIASKRVAYAALQQSVATALARDILERMRANPQQAMAYRTADWGVTDPDQSVPDVNCDHLVCSAAQLVAYDLWQWQAALRGAAQRQAGRAVGGLLLPRACISNDNGTVVVAISWLGVRRSRTIATPLCDADHQPAGSGVIPASYQRNQLQIATFILGQQ